MNPTTNQPNMQPQNSGQLSHDELSATLAHATYLQEQMMPKEAPQEAQNGSQSQVNGENGNDAEDTKMTDLETKIDKKLEILRDELKGSQKVEIDSIRKDIKDALTGEGTNEQN